jgi:hypothetical protein
MGNTTLIEHLTAVIEELRAAEGGLDWVTDLDEILTIAEASELAGVTPETMRRWCGDFQLGRLFASSLWLVSRRRLLVHIERRHGRAAMLKAAGKGKNRTRCLPSQVRMPVGTTSARW